MFQEWLNHTGVRFKGEGGNLYTHFELEQNRVKTHGGDDVRVQVPVVGHVVGGHLRVGMVCGHEEQLQHEGVCRQQHVRPRGPGPQQEIFRSVSMRFMRMLLIPNLPVIVRNSTHLHVKIRTIRNLNFWKLVKFF